MEQNTPDLTLAWRGVVDDLQPNQRAWLRASEPVTLHESTAIVAVPNDFTRNQVEGRLRPSSRTPSRCASAARSGSR